ncbi:DUF6261 family protein [Parabacteroides faecis]|uniref:DUF6261 family protein n=1 Tax=Parabacteroides faecis TaxID=1217282 RepID=UPI0021640102|nr:DUF6261 family protein [Parabacteroides faecis]MCS2894607.1 DUF6261 family protein [Parabacteroides faecis]UVQ46809.1 DUF6261 family protein [Parabacteroides faecis]
MANIQTFAPITRLRSNELLTFGRAIETKIEEAGADTLQIAPIFTIYQTTLQEVDDSIMRIRKSTYTPEMTAADNERDYTQSGLLGQIDIFQRHYDPTLKAHAVSLYPVYNAFKGKTQISYEEQTGVTDNLIQELESDKYKAAVAALGLTGWVADLKTKNQVCKTLSATRITETGTRNTSPKLEESRKLFQKAYKDIVTRLNALAEVNGDTPYLALFAWWNALIDRNRTLISNRLGAGKGGNTSKGDNDRPVITPEEGGGGDRPEIE